MPTEEWPPRSGAFDGPKQSFLCSNPIVEKSLYTKQVEFAERIMHIQFKLCRHGNEKEWMNTSTSAMISEEFRSD